MCIEGKVCVMMGMVCGLMGNVCVCVCVCSEGEVHVIGGECVF